MAWTVRVRNFQSIEDATIVIDGLVVITGPNNSGKTALMRAIRGVFTNAPAGPLVRRGASHLTVDIDFGDGNTVRWEKGDKVNKYTLNGHPLENVGRGCPQEVLALGVQPIHAGTETVWPQIADQFKVLFLIGSPGSAVAEAVADVERVGKLNSALRLAESDRRSATSTLAVRRSDETTLIAQVAAYETLPQVETLVVQVESRTAETEELERQLVVARTLRTRRTAQVALVESLEGLGLVQVPDAARLTEIRGHRNALLKCVELRDGLARSRREVQTLSGVSDVPVPSATELATLQTELQAAKGLAVRLKKARRVASVVEAVVAQPIPEIGKVEKMRDTLAFLRSCKTRRDAANVPAIERELAGLDRDLQQAVAEVLSLLGDRGECPTCGRVVDGHHHGEVA